MIRNRGTRQIKGTIKFENSRESEYKRKKDNGYRADGRH